MASQPNLPIIVNASAVQAGVLAALRVLITLVTGFLTLVPLIGKADLEGIYAFFADNAGLTFITAAIAVVTFGLSVWRTVVKHRQLVTTATVAPNSVAVVQK